jgi:hypothetical protein
MNSSKQKYFALAATCSMALSLVARDARSQVDDEAAARSLFNEGRKLAREGDYPAACPKFEAAGRAFGSVGVLINLGDCYEKIGRTASAWRTFGDAASAAARVGRDGDELESRRRQAALEPRLDHLAIHVADAAPGLSLKNDGAEIPREDWDLPIPLDPGAHQLIAVAPGRQEWKQSFEISGEDHTITFEVPALPTSARPSEVSPVSKSLTVASEAPSATGRGQRWVGMAVGGVGIAALAAGGVIGLVAKANYNAAANEIGDPRHTDSLSAFNLGNVGTVVFVGGAVAAAAGFVVWLTAPTAPARIGTNGRELLVRGAF